MGELSEDGSNDWEALDASAAHIANLLSTEPADGTLKAKYLQNNYLPIITDFFIIMVINHTLYEIIQQPRRPIFLLRIEVQNPVV